MTKGQFNEIKQRLSKWREVRHLTYEDLRRDFLGNVFQKVSEYFRAKDDVERINSLCHIAISYLNSFDTDYVMGRIRCNEKYHFSYVLKNIADLSQDLELHFDEIDELNLSKEHMNNALNNIVNLSKDLSFDFYQCMLEAVKELESKTGEYDTKLKRFVEDTGAYTEEEAYKIANSYDKENETELYVDDNDKWVYEFPNPNLQRAEKYPYVTFTVKKWYKPDYESCRMKEK